MDNLLGEDTVVGYCTNVHAGATWEQTKENLDRYALSVKKRVSPADPMGIGLWLSSDTALDILGGAGPRQLASYLEDVGLRVFTLNGFPYGDFHEKVVKHKVYKPDWADEDRFDYTMRLVSILSELVPDMGEGSISTLPLGWGKAGHSETDFEKAISQLVRLSEQLQENEIETGKLIHVDLEPEPGCYLDRCRNVVDVFKERLFLEGDEDVVRRYIRVCHDICHSAVMFEDQEEILNLYREPEIRIGKVQVSSAIKIDFDALEEEEKGEALKQLESFQEDRYLHQTVVRRPGGMKTFFEDLPRALETLSEEEGGTPEGEWRVHFHVPIFLDNAGILGTTQDQILAGLPLLLESGVKQFEVETYAWNVLPEELQVEDLSEGIAQEIEWLGAQAAW